MLRGTDDAVHDVSPDNVPDAAPDAVPDAVTDAVYEFAVMNDDSIVSFLKVSLNLVLNDALHDAVPDVVVLNDASDMSLMLTLLKTESLSEWLVSSFISE